MVTVKRKCHSELGAHTIGARNEDRFSIAARHFEKCAKTTNTCKHTLTHGLAGERLDTVNQGIARIDVNARVFVAQRRLQVWV